MRLKPLSESPDFTFPAGAFDVRGWEVRTAADGEKVGEVVDLLIDDHGGVRYLDVDLGPFEKHVLLPVDRARVDDAESAVWVTGMTRSRFESVPEYDGDASGLGAAEEERLRDAYGGEPGAAPTGTPAGEPAAARGGASRRPGGHLASLDDMEEYRVASDDPDPRGWGVVGSDGERVGRVADLLVDTAAMKVRYLACEVDADRKRRVLIPIGYARLDEPGEAVIVDAIPAREMAALPPYPGLPLPRAYEEELLSAYTGDAGARGGARGALRITPGRRQGAPGRRPDDEKGASRGRP